MLETVLDCLKVIYMYIVTNNPKLVYNILDLLYKNKPAVPLLRHDYPVLNHSIADLLLVKNGQWRNLLRKPSTQNYT